MKKPASEKQPIENQVSEKPAAKKPKRDIRLDIQTLYYATQNKQIGFWAKFWTGLAIAYALSPIDLIPDFIPVLGMLDDALILPVFIYLAFKSIPPEIIEESRKKAQAEPLNLAKNWKGALLVLSIWGLLLFAIIKAFFLK